MEDSLLDGGTYRGYRVSVRLVRENRKRYAPRALSSSDAAYEFFKPIGEFDRECFYVAHLDTRNRIISCEEVSRGNLCGSMVHPREVYKAAILSSAASILVAHNHPSGDPTPSESDRLLTRRLFEVGELLGIPLLDSIVVGDGEYRCLSEMR